MSDLEFFEYGAGGGALPWKGYLADEAGRPAFYVDLEGNHWSMTGNTDDNGDHRGSTTHRNSAWNSLRDQLFSLCDLESENGGVDYWPKSNLACLLSLVRKETERRIATAKDPEKRRLERVRDDAERIFGYAEYWALAVGPRKIR